MQTKIHFWDFPNKITVKLKPHFRREFFTRIINHFGTSENAAKFLNHKKILKRRFSGSELRHYKTDGDDCKYDFIYIDCIKEFSKVLGYDLLEVEKNIRAYRASNTSYIFYKKLPLKVTPELTSILAHMIGDGSDRRTRGGAADYTQFSIEGRENFYHKMVNVFGKFNRSPLNIKGKRVAVPSTVSILLKEFYSIKSFGNDCKIPQKFFSLPKDHQLSFLVSLLVDEGTIYDFVNLRMNNKDIVESWRKIAILLGYKCSSVHKTLNKNGSYCYGCNLSNHSLDNLYKDIKELSQSYPTCDLILKQSYFDFLTKLGRGTRKKRGKNLTKKLIIKYLTLRPLKVLEISRLVGVCRRTVRVHLEDLKRKNKVCIDSKNIRGAAIWRSS